ncbi:hypothetical protein BFX34_04230 [Vibrio cholerae]|nr:hypothetical protein BFX34_04230 [Vibrio cholerae]
MVLAEELFGEEYYIDLSGFKFNINEFHQVSIDDELEYYSEIVYHMNKVSTMLFGAPFKVVEVDINS